jgi:dihydrofolate synthase/folylpolyglutamate synthase
MEFNTLQDVTDALQKHVLIVSKTAGYNQSLDRMWPVLERVGSPHKRLKTIHVAGTSGKTSTCYYITALLHDSGMKTGTTVSPHVDSITERVQINGQPIADELFCKYFTEFYSIVESSVQKVSYFELLVIFELWVFMREGVDYAVIETGMGGLLDATNVLTRDDKVAVVTAIGYDHMHVLGNTLSEIAYQKAGIIHENNHVFYADQSDEISTVLEKRIHDKNAHPHICKHDAMNESLQLPEFQKKNWLITSKVVQYVAERDNFYLADSNPTHILVPARMEQVFLEDGTLLIMDGAHNEQKMHAFVESYQKRFSGKKAAILLALKKGKEYESVLRNLEPIAASFIFTTFNTSQDLPATSQDPKTLHSYTSKHTAVESTVVRDLKEAYVKLLESPADIKIATGSFYMLGQLRAL